MTLDPSLQLEANAASVSKEPEENLRLFPPPLFSRQTISQSYKYVFCLFLLHPH